MTLEPGTPIRHKQGWFHGVVVRSVPFYGCKGYIFTVTAGPRHMLGEQDFATEYDIEPMDAEHMLTDWKDLA